MCGAPGATDVMPLDSRGRAAAAFSRWQDTRSHGCPRGPHGPRGPHRTTRRQSSAVSCLRVAAQDVRNGGGEVREGLNRTVAKTECGAGRSKSATQEGGGGERPMAAPAPDSGQPRGTLPTPPVCRRCGPKLVPPTFRCICNRCASLIGAAAVLLSSAGCACPAACSWRTSVSARSICWWARTRKSSTGRRCASVERRRIVASGAAVRRRAVHEVRRRAGSSRADVQVHMLQRM